MKKDDSVVEPSDAEDEEMGKEGEEADEEEEDSADNLDEDIDEKAGLKRQKK